MALIYNTRQTVANGAEAWFKIKVDLKLQGWTVPSSSDGTTYNASGDQITLAGAGAGGMNNNSAWFRLRSPDGSIEYLVQRGTTELLWREKVSVAGFVTGAPSATVAPTAADQQQLRGADTPTFVTQFGTAGTYSLTTIVSNAAPYSFCCFCVASGGTAVSMLFVRDPMVGADVSDVEPYVHWVTTTALGLLTAIGTGTGWATNNGGGPAAWLRKGLSGEGFVAVGLNFESVFNSAGANSFYTNNGGGYHSTGADVLQSPKYVRPAGDTAPVGTKGVSFFFRLVSAVRACTDYEQVGAVRAFMVLGPGVAVVWNDTTPAW